MGEPDSTSAAAGQYPIVDLPLDHPMFRTQFVVNKVPQIPSINFWMGSGGGTSEAGYDSQTPEARAILGPNGRPMVLDDPQHRPRRLVGARRRRSELLLHVRRGRIRVRDQRGPVFDDQLGTLTRRPLRGRPLRGGQLRRGVFALRQGASAVGLAVSCGAPLRPGGPEDSSSRDSLSWRRWPVSVCLPLRRRPQPRRTTTAKPRTGSAVPGKANDACAIDLTTTVVAPDGKLTRETFTANPKAPIDCFYVYPDGLDRSRTRTATCRSTPRSRTSSGSSSPASARSAGSLRRCTAR